MKRIILTEAQLKEYVERKKAEKIFYDIVESLYKNKKNLNENFSLDKANNTVLKAYKAKNLLTPRVHEMLIKYKVIDEERNSINNL